MLDEGTVAPEFTLPDQNGAPVSLSEFRSQWVVLWWFPKAFTEG
jgi:thioredoxin-dependent peroxiredoxin